MFKVCLGKLTNGHTYLYLLSQVNGRAYSYSNSFSASFDVKYNNKVYAVKAALGGDCHCLGKDNLDIKVRQTIPLSLRSFIYSWSTQLIKREYDIYIQMKFRHKNVLPLLGVYHEMADSQLHDCHINLVFLRMKNGNLRDYMCMNPSIDHTSLVRFDASNLTV